MNYCNQKQDYVKADKLFYLICRLVSCYQADGRLPDNPKRQSLVGGGFQRAEPFGGYEVEKKSAESFVRRTSMTSKNFILLIVFCGIIFLWKKKYHLALNR